MEYKYPVIFFFLLVINEFYHYAKIGKRSELSDIELSQFLNDKNRTATLISTFIDQLINLAV